MENSLTGNAVLHSPGGERPQSPAADAVVPGLTFGGAPSSGFPAGRQHRDPPIDTASANLNLRKAFATLGLELGQRQSVLLAECYGAGTMAVRAMVSDGVLSSTQLGEGGLSWSLNWSAVNPERLASAVLRLGSEGADTSMGATAVELARGLDRLFDRTGVLAASKARKIVRLFGKEGRVLPGQIAQAVNLSAPRGESASPTGPINLLKALESEIGRPAIGPVGLPGPTRTRDGTPDWSRTEHAMVTYVMAFANVRGQLSLPQFSQALASLSATGGLAEGQPVSTLFLAYAVAGPKGPVIGRAKVEEMVRRKALGASPRPGGGYGFRVTPAVLTVDRTATGQSDGRTISRSGELAILPASIGIHAGLNQTVAQQPVDPLAEPDDDPDPAGSDSDSGTGQVLLGLGLNATIFGNLIIDYDRLQQRKRLRFSNIPQLVLTQLSAEQIAHAIFQQAGRDPEVECLTTAEFETAVQDLTGDTAALTAGLAEVLVRLANTPLLIQGQANGPETVALRGTAIRFESVVTVFERRFVEIVAGSGRTAHVVRYNPDLAFADADLVFEYLGSHAQDPTGLLSQDELCRALSSAAFRDFVDPGATAARLCLILGDGPGRPEAVPAGALRMAAQSGAVALGPDPADGLQLDLARLSTGRIATAMFRVFGLDAERDGLSAQQFDEALERVSGDRGAISTTDVDFLIAEYASDLHDGSARLTQADVVSILRGELSLLSSSSGPDMRVGNRIDPRHRRPAFTNPATWNSGASLAGSFANDLVQTVSATTGLCPLTVIRVIGHIGSWGLREPEAGQLVHDALQGIWSAANPDVMAATTALTQKLKTCAGLTEDAHELLGDYEAQFRAGRSDGALFLHVFKSGRSAAVPLLNAAARSLSPWLEADQPDRSGVLGSGPVVISRGATPGQDCRSRVAD